MNASLSGREVTGLEELPVSVTQWYVLTRASPGPATVLPRRGPLCTE